MLTTDSTRGGVNSTEIITLNLKKNSNNFNFNYSIQGILMIL